MTMLSVIFLLAIAFFSRGDCKCKCKGYANPSKEGDKCTLWEHDEFWCYVDPTVCPDSWKHGYHWSWSSEPCDICEFKEGDGIGGTEVRIDTEKKPYKGNRCAAMCMDAGYNGATIRANGERGCWCEKGMTGINKASKTYRTCRLPVCEFENGDGNGKTEVRIDTEKNPYTGNQCARMCMREDKGYNGATIRANGERGCWCEKGMTGVQASSTFKTCRFPEEAVGENSKVLNLRTQNERLKQTNRALRQAVEELSYN